MTPPDIIYLSKDEMRARRRRKAPEMLDWLIRYLLPIIAIILALFVLCARNVQALDKGEWSGAPRSPIEVEVRGRLHLCLPLE